MLARVKETRVNNAYEKLKTDILSGELAPGFQAPEPEIAARLEMSRTPVREALIRLEAEGLVSLIPRRGAKVLSIQLQDLTEVMEILAALEGLAAPILARLENKSDALAELECASTAALLARDQNDLNGWIDQDDRFHRIIARYSNARLEREIGLNLDQIHRAVRVLTRMNGAPVEADADHRSLIEAFSGGNENAACEIAQAHRLNALQTLRSVFERSGVSQL
ncbi:MAG: GntR family transcriptional regulator [Labrenzia sp.]